MVRSRLVVVGWLLLLSFFSILFYACDKWKQDTKYCRHKRNIFLWYKYALCCRRARKYIDILAQNARHYILAGRRHSLNNKQHTTVTHSEMCMICARKETPHTHMPIHISITICRERSQIVFMHSEPILTQRNVESEWDRETQREREMERALYSNNISVVFMHGPTHWKNAFSSPMFIYTHS